MPVKPAPRPTDSRRQPVHVVYGGAHLFRRDTARKLGALAIQALNEYAPTPLELSRAFGLPEGDPLAKVFERVKRKLEIEPVEDLRIDFEDGYGDRSDAEEDAHAAAAAEELAKGLAAGTLPPFVGIRIKALSGPSRERSLRTLELFIKTALGSETRRLPSDFVVTLPKITSPTQPAALARALGTLEKRLRLAKGTLKIELMVETPRSILDENGAAALPELVAACGGRCAAAHFGSYDYTASLDITAAHQSMLHPACDFAKHMMQLSLAGTGVHLSDGATNVLPVPIHRPEPGQRLFEGQKEENRAAVHRAWKLHFDQIRHSLAGGFYQGWDLHPAQLPSRYAAVYSFFLNDFEETAMRLKRFVERAARATLAGGVFDDAATGQGLLNFFLRGLGCGAFTPEETLAAGLTREELLSRSFRRIVDGRSGRS